MRLYGDRYSGNCYKVQMILNRLGQPFDWVEVDVTRGETRTPEFLARNPIGKVPVLEVAPGVHLAESNAILCYLAEGSPWLPADRLERARALGWMFFEQYSHEPHIATSRYWIRYLGGGPDYAERLAGKRAGGLAALAVMERHLTGRRWLAGDAASVADLTLYAYTHVAPEGGFDLAPYPAIRAWLDRVAAEPGHLAMGA